MTLAEFLKRDFESEALEHGEGSIVVSQPRNGAEIPLPDNVVAEVRRFSGSIGSVTVTVNGQLVNPERGDEDQLQPDGSFLVKIDVPLTNLQPGENMIVISATGDQEFSRTLKVQVRDTAGK